jgi:excisionase family DNA binding protein
MVTATLTEVLTLEEVATYLRLAPEVVERQTAQGQMPGRKIENDWRFLKSAINDWLSTPNHRGTLLRQVGALAHDETLAELRDSIYSDRGRLEVDVAEDT